MLGSSFASSMHQRSSGGRSPRRGPLILEGTPGAFARFQARAASEYIEFAPAFAYHGETFRRRLIEQNPVMVSPDEARRDGAVSLRTSFAQFLTTSRS